MNLLDLFFGRRDRPSPSLADPESSDLLQQLEAERQTRVLDRERANARLLQIQAGLAQLQAEAELARLEGM